MIFSKKRPDPEDETTQRNYFTEKKAHEKDKDKINDVLDQIISKLENSKKEANS